MNTPDYLNEKIARLEKQIELMAPYLTPQDMANVLMRLNGLETVVKPKMRHEVAQKALDDFWSTFEAHEWKALRAKRPCNCKEPCRCSDVSQHLESAKMIAPDRSLQ